MVNECIPFFEAAYTQKLTAHFDTLGVGKTFSGPLKGRQSGPGLAADPLAAGDGGNYKVNGAPAANGEVGGVVMWDVAAGAKGGLVRGEGTILPVKSGAAIALNDLLKVDAQGRVVPAAQVIAGAQPVNWVVGRAHSAVGAADLDVEVELIAPHRI